MAPIKGLTCVQRQRLEEARSLSAEDMERLERKELTSPEELRLLLYKVVDEEYHN